MSFERFSQRPASRCPNACCGTGRILSASITLKCDCSSTNTTSTSPFTARASTPAPLYPLAKYNALSDPKNSAAAFSTPSVTSLFPNPARVVAVPIPSRFIASQAASANSTRAPMPRYPVPAK